MTYQEKNPGTGQGVGVQMDLTSGIATTGQDRAIKGQALQVGATPAEWDTFTLLEGLTRDIVPVVSDATLPVSAESSLSESQRGKVPSVINAQGCIAGLPRWSERVSSDDDVTTWRQDGRYGFGIIARDVRAIDVDCNDHANVARVRDVVLRELGHDLPTRSRSNSARILMTARVPGQWPKERIAVGPPGEFVEVLGEKQQFIACGTHPSGVRYEWAGLDGGIPSVTAEAWSRCIEALYAEFGQVRPDGEHIGSVGNATAEPIEKLRLALATLDARTMGYETGLRDIAFAVHEATGGSDEGLALYLDFSCTHPKHDQRFVERSLWSVAKTERAGGMVRRNTLFEMADKADPAWRDRWREIEMLRALGLFEDVAPAGEEGEAAPTLKPADVLIDCTDAGNANVLREITNGNMRFVSDTEEWMHWTGCQWVVDATRSMTLAQAKRVSEHWTFKAKALRQQAEGERDDTRREELQALAGAFEAHAKKCRSRATIDAMLSLAERDHRMVIRLTELDQQRNLLGVANGVTDMRTGTLLPNGRDMLVTKHSPFAYRPGAAAPRWRRFIDEITGRPIAPTKLDDESVDPAMVGRYESRPHLAAYLQALLGYSSTGEVREQKMAVWEGAGANGKDVALGAVGRVLGPYASVIPPEALMSTRRDADANAPSPITAGLIGVRLAVSSESREGQRLDVALIKRHTGNTRMTGRKLHANPVEFDPTHKLLLMTNAAPGLDHLDDAIRGRVHRLKFERRWNRPGHPDPDPSLPDGDKGLSDALEAESEGVLAWLVEGATRYYRDGLEPPPEVVGATVEFFDAADSMGHWLATWDRCPAREGTAAGALFTQYGLWCRANGQRQQHDNPTAFGKALQRRGVQRVRMDKGTLYGLRSAVF